MSRMSAEEYLLSLMRAEHLPDLFRGAALGALALFEVEGAYVLRLEMGRWRVVGAAGVGKKALGLRLPREWEPPSGPTPPPGPLGFSPDGREREGFALRRGNLAFLLEGALPPSGREEHLSLLLEALALRAERLASLSYTGFSAGAIFRLEEGVCRLWVVAGEYPEGYLFLHLKEPVSWGEGATRVLRDSPSGFALIPDYQFYPHALPAFQRQGLRTVVQVLLERSGEPYGILSLASFGRTVVAGPETERLLLVARDELEAYLERRLQVEGTLEAIARILEGLDYETEGHMRRVSHLAVLLGVRAGVRDLEGLRMGAYLHDLGKLFLPREVLNKPGNLDTGEWQAVMTHPEMGYEVLSRIPFLPKTALEVVLHHHEHWDGTGYPKGLKGEEIPLVARVFAVADVWDALLSRRAYKPALAEDAARMELLAMAGRKLDPGLVELFLEQLEAVGP